MSRGPKPIQVMLSPEEENALKQCLGRHQAAQQIALRADDAFYVVEVSSNNDKCSVMMMTLTIFSSTHVTYSSIHRTCPNT